MPRQTFHAKPGQVKTSWRHVDASGKVLGRLATEVATVLMGKHRPEYTPNVDTGDAVIVTNAAKIVLTGRKAEQKTLRRWSGYPGGLKVETYGDLLTSNPERVVTAAIVRMLPRGRLGRRFARKLRVFAGEQHGHGAQQPIPMQNSSAR
ncbi:MAG: 50S ribosomal protein L13 [Phycisphaerae bacterium]|nr:50S ribosomal protein L13 [Phycisphaerae bacterium]